ncbi:MAG TPA: hypothetical protein VFX61_08910 [Micromonosporaceae bacterium]|nr:hypothetical protein [Micromonosporaceae bacterium]
MAHVELSISEPLIPRQRSAAAITADHIGSFHSWIATVSGALEPCLVINLDTIISAASVTCCNLLGLDVPANVVGRPLLDGGLRLIDFTAARTELSQAETDKIPPLLAISSGRLARGLLRVQTGVDGETDATVDAIATPLLIDGVVAGSLTFFSEV